MRKLNTSSVKADRIRGRSLVELLIAMVIALVAIGAVVSAISGTSLTGSQQNVYAEFDQEVAVATSLIGSQFKNAGFTQIRKANAGPLEDSDYEGPAVTGCANGYVSISAADPVCAPLAAGASISSIRLLYQATPDNTDFAGTNPQDCLGDSIPLGVSPFSGAANFALADNRYQVITTDPANPNRLRCAGPGNDFTPDTLFNNINNLTIVYGVAGVEIDAIDGHGYPGSRIIAFLTSTQIDALGQMTPGSSGLVPTDTRLSPWQRVLSVRMCMSLATGNDVLPEPMSDYLDCAGAVIVPANNDRQIHRSVKMDFAIKNRTSPCADSAAPLSAAAVAAGVVPTWCPQSSNATR